MGRIKLFKQISVLKKAGFTLAEIDRHLKEKDIFSECEELIRRTVTPGRCAINAGNRALNSLRTARENLNSAKNWGLVDMFGSGLDGTGSD